MDFFSEIKGVLSRRQALNRVLTFRHSCFVMLPLHDILSWIGVSCVSFFSHSTQGIDHSSSSDATTSFLRWYSLADSSSASRKRVRAQLLALIASYILRHDSLRGFGHACRRRVAAMKRSVETTMGCPTLRCFILSRSAVSRCRRSTNEAVSCRSHLEHLRLRSAGRFVALNGASKLKCRSYHEYLLSLATLAFRCSMRQRKRVSVAVQN